MSHTPTLPLKSIVWLLPLALMLTVAALLLSHTPAYAAPPAQSPTEKPSVSAGQALWGENCMPCHGDGHGNGPTAASLPSPPPNMTAPETARQYIPSQNFDTIKNGRMEKMMPPWKERLTDAQIWDAAAYVWSLGTSPQTLSAGQTVYAAQCAACHGEDGSGNGPQASAGINDFTDIAAMMQVSQADLLTAYNASSNHTDLAGLSEDDIWASLDYARSFSFELPARNGILTGQVINAATGQPVGNVEIALHAFQNNTQLETISATADESGNYRFENLLTDHSVMYVVEGLYQDVGYVSQEPGMFVPDSNETSVNLEVYDTTTNGDAINITQMHYLLSFSPGAVNVLQILIVGNGGDKTFVGANGQTFPIALPENATNVNFQNDPNGDRFTQTDSGYADTEPIVPGEEALTIATMYDIPFNGDTATINLPLTADTNTVDVLMNQQGATLESPNVSFIDNRDFQGNSFAMFNGTGYRAGDTISLQLSGLNDLEFTMPGSEINAPAAAADTSWFNQEMAKWAVLGVGLVAIVIAVVVYPRARPQLTHQPDLPGEETPEARQQRLLLTLARLDETYEAGELDETIYQRARARYKAELAQLMEFD